jgi:hypothetical protein
MHCYRFYQPGTAQPIPSGSAGYVFEYRQLDKNNRVIRFSWITDLAIAPENVEEIMQAGRSSVEDRKPNLQDHEKPEGTPWSIIRDWARSITVRCLPFSC